MWPDGWAMNQMTLHMRHAPSSPLQPAVRNKSLTWCEAADCKGAEEGSAVEEQQCLRTRFLQDHPEALHRFTSDLLPLLLQVYGSTVLEKVGSSSVCGAFRSSAVAGLQRFWGMDRHCTLFLWVQQHPQERKDTGCWVS